MRGRPAPMVLRVFWQIGRELCAGAGSRPPYQAEDTPQRPAEYLRGAIAPPALSDPCALDGTVTLRGGAGPHSHKAPVQ